MAVVEFNEEHEFDLVADKFAEEAAVLSSEERAQRADEMKKQGNDCFSSKDYHKSAFFYSCALLFTPENEVLYSNRAQCRLKLEEYGSALLDGQAAVKLNSSFVKGHYRVGCAYIAMGKYKLAKEALTTAYKMKPDAETKGRLEACTKILRDLAFQAAIASEMTANVMDKVQVKGLPSSYTGPKFDPEQVYEVNGNKYTMDLWRWATEQMREQKKLPLELMQVILRDAFVFFKEQPSLIDVRINSKINVCGDTHGQYYDVLNIFKLFGEPSAENPYLFNGDFVDRGSFGVEIVMALLLAKLACPQSMYLSRGNHESTSLQSVYGFKGEVLHKANAFTYDLFTELFNALPLGHVLQNKVLVVHGGLFENDKVTLDDIRALNRFQQPPEAGPMCDILWSDPGARLGKQPPHRGCGIVFGSDITKKFLADNGLELLVRSHEMKQEGYTVDHDGKCVTIFSAPNYCDQMGNKGAVLIFDADAKYQVRQFAAVPHPNVPAMAYANSAMRF